MEDTDDFWALLMWTIFKIFIECVTILFLFYVLVFWLRGIWDLSFPTRDQTCTPYSGRQSLKPLDHQADPSFWALSQVECSRVGGISVWVQSVLGICGVGSRTVLPHKHPPTTDARIHGHPGPSYKMM